MQRLLLVLLFLIACTPSSYDVIQYERDSGFAGATGVVERELRFTVLGDEVQDEVNGTPLTVEDLEGRVAKQLWSVELPVDDQVCQWHEIEPVEASILCRRDGEIVYYHNVEAKGNHQSTDFIWRHADVPLLDHPACELTDGFLCPLMAHQSEETCQTLGERIGYCLRMVEKANPV